MGELLKTTASDGHEFTSYLTQPTSTPLGGLVIIQEIFGVNKHIKSIADKYAKDTYNGEALSLALKKLSVDSLSNLYPHPLYVFIHYSHPPLLKRLSRLNDS